MLKKFHNKAKKLNKENISDIQILKTNDGEDCNGFTFLDKNELVKIYYHDSSSCFCIEVGHDDAHEIGLYELK